MEAILMLTDTQKFNDTIKQYSIYLSEYNEILSAYNKLNLESITVQDFKKLIVDTPALIFEKMTKGEETILAGLKVNKSKALEIFEKPEGYDFLIDLISQLKSQKPNFGYYLRYVDIVNEEVVLLQSVLDLEFDNSKLYAVTDKEKRAFEFAEAVIALGKEKFADKKVNLPNLIKMIIDCQPVPFGSTNLVNTINVRAIKTINNINI